MKKFFSLLITFLLVSLSGETSQTIYSNGFEETDDLPVRYFHFDWWSVYKTRVKTHAMGPAPAPLLTGYDLGKKSFKIDYTFLESGKTMHLYLKPEKDFLITDPMTQSAYLKIEEDSGLKVEIGAYVVYGEPHIPGKSATVNHWSSQKAFIPADHSELPNGWTYTTMNLFRQAKRFERNHKMKNTDAYYGGLLIMVSGKKNKNIQKGDRITLYLDDVSVQKSGISSRMNNPKIAEKMYLLGERKRYEVRNRLYRRTVSGNSLRNAGFELGFEGWDHSRRDLSNMIHKELSPDAAEGKIALKITHDTEINSLVWSDIIHRRSNGKYKVTFLAKALGSMTVGGQKIGPTWKLYSLPVWDSSKGTPGNVVSYVRGETDQKFVLFSIQGKGSLWLDAVSTDPARTETNYSTLPYPELGIGFKEGKAICNVLTDKESFDINLFLWNGGLESGLFRMKYTVDDFFGKRIQEGVFSEEMKANSGFSKNIPFPKGIRGIFYVRFSVETPAGQSFDTENSCAVIRPLDSQTISSESIFGLSKPGAAQFDKTLFLARMIGAKGINQNRIMETLWGESMKDWRTKKENGEKLFHYPLAGGEREKELLNAGIEPLYLVRGIPSFLRPGSPYSYPNKLLSDAAMKEYASLVELYATEMDPSRKRFFDLWPEGCPDEKKIILMKPYIKAISDALHRASPQAEVLGCGFWEVSMMGKQVEWAAKHGYFREGLLDGVTIHPYAANPDVSYMDAGLKQVRSILDRERPGMPIIAAEVGYQNLTTFYSDIKGLEVQGWNSIYSEERTADYLIRMMLIGLRHKVKRIMVFPALSSGGMPYPHHFGMTYHLMMRPKASLPALAGLTDQIHDAKFLAISHPGPGYSAQLMSRKRGDFLLAIWSFSDNKGLVTSVEIPSVTGVRFWDAMNNEFKVEENKFLLPGGSPVMLQASSREILEKISSGLKLHPLIASPSLQVRNGNVFLVLKNSLPQPISLPCNLKITFTTGKVAEQYFSLEGNANGTTERLIAPLSSISSLEVSIGQRNGKTLLKFRPISVPRISNGFSRKTLGDRELRWRENAKVRLYPVSASDLSGIFQYAYDQDFLYLNFTEKDSKYSQPHSGPGIWCGDSIQLAFDPLCNTQSITRSYQFDDIEIGAALLPDGKKELIRYHGSDSFLKGVHAEIKKIRDGMEYQFKISWKELGIVPQPGTIIGFNFTINDKDDSAMDKYLTLPPGGIAEPNGKCPFFFSDLVLE